jgi:hypothetical protein
MMVLWEIYKKKKGQTQVTIIKIIYIYIYILFQIYLPNSTEKAPYWEANSHSASQEIHHLLWKLKFHYCVHKSPPLSPTLCHMNPVHHPLSYFFNIHLNIILYHLHQSLSRGLFPSCFQIKTVNAFLSLPYVLHALPISPSFILSP